MLQDEEGVKLLLDSGADPTLGNSVTGGDSTPLHYCCTRGWAALAQLLLATGRMGKAVNQRAQQGFVPLHLAARRGSAACVRLLLEHGADPAEATEQGATALQLARVNKHSAVEALLQ